MRPNYLPDAMITRSRFPAEISL